MRAKWRGKTQPGETSLESSFPAPAMPALASDELTVPGGKSGGGTWWYQVLKLDSKPKTEDAGSTAPHTVA